MFLRDLDLRSSLVDMSILLLGPRQTGKSTLLRSVFPESMILDLLEPELFERFKQIPFTTLKS